MPGSFLLTALLAPVEKEPPGVGAPPPKPAQGGGHSDPVKPDREAKGNLDPHTVEVAAQPLLPSLPPETLAQIKDKPSLSKQARKRRPKGMIDAQLFCFLETVPYDAITQPEICQVLEIHPAYASKMIPGVKAKLQGAGWRFIRSKPNRFERTDRAIERRSPGHLQVANCKATISQELQDLETQVLAVLREKSHERVTYDELSALLTAKHSDFRSVMRLPSLQAALEQEGWRLVISRPKRLVRVHRTTKEIRVVDPSLVFG